MSSEDRKGRVFAIDRVMEIRAGSEKGDESVRPRKTPNINLETTTLRGLIDWEKETLYEPIFTCSLSLNDLDGLGELYSYVPIIVTTLSPLRGQCSR